MVGLSCRIHGDGFICDKAGVRGTLTGTMVPLPVDTTKVRFARAHTPGTLADDGLPLGGRKQCNAVRGSDMAKQHPSILAGQTPQPGMASS